MASSEVRPDTQSKEQITALSKAVCDLTSEVQKLKRERETGAVSAAERPAKRPALSAPANSSGTVDGIYCTTPGWGGAAAATGLGIEL